MSIKAIYLQHARKAAMKKSFQIVLCVIASGCTSNATRKQVTFFEAVELAREAPVEQVREAFESACDRGAAAACFQLGKRVRLGGRLAVLQGVTDDTHTEIMALVDSKVKEPRFFLWSEDGRLVEPAAVRAVEIPASNAKMHQLEYAGLQPGTRYRWQAVDSEARLLDARDLSSLETSARRGRIAVASCLEDRHPQQAAMWEELLRQNPDAIFLIGDNVYADLEASASGGLSTQPANADQLWRRYTENRQTLSLYVSQRLTPVFAVWDDHDYGASDGDSSYPLKAEAKRVFRAFFGQAAYPGSVDRGPGVSMRLQAFGQRFFFLDNRTFRSPVASSNQTHFGVDQESWLFTELYGETPTWLISGDQFFGGYHRFESYQGRHPSSFERFLRRLRSQSAPVLFLSGDRHLTELMQIPTEVLGYTTYELTTSPLHGKVYPNPWTEQPNPLQIAGVAQTLNYALIDTEARGGLSAYVRVYGPGEKRLFSKTLELTR